MNKEQFDMFNYFANISGMEISPTEKAGRYKSMEEEESNIFDDIKNKLHLQSKKNILDIGCGCGTLSRRIIDFANKENLQLTLNDSSEVINQIKNNIGNFRNINFIEGRFPDIKLRENIMFDAIILYSVIHYIQKDKIFDFIESAVYRLKPKGSILIGDIPNIDKRNRFANSKFGKEFNLEWKKTQKNCFIEQNYPSLNLDHFNDSLIIEIVRYVRSKKNLNAYILPQPSNLPFGYIRDDILISKT